jgi:lysophospholipase L1-like esterase
MENLKPAQQEYILQFRHPDKILAPLPGLTDASIAGLFALPVARYCEIRQPFARNAQRAAAELLTEDAFAADAARLPFTAGQTVVGLGDSITDDLQSWLEILRYVLDTVRPGNEIRLVNAGISGDTTSQMISRFLAVVAEQPAWIICMAGTNDTRRHGTAPTKILVSLEETMKNLVMLRRFAATETAAQWVWMTPAGVIPEKIAAHWFLGAFEMMWRNEDLTAVADVVRGQADPVVDLQEVFGCPPNADLLLPDGLHPSLAGQKAITRALVAKLAACE